MFNLVYTRYFSRRSVGGDLLSVTVLKPSGSGSAVGPEGGIPAAATSLYDKVIPAGIEIAGKP
jgi:hypothetical protein